MLPLPLLTARVLLELNELDALIVARRVLYRHLFAQSIGSRRRNPTMSRATPRIASGMAAIDGIMAVLMPLAKSDGFGEVDEFAIVLKVQFIPRTVAITQRADNASKVHPAQRMRRDARVFVLLAIEPGV